MNLTTRARAAVVRFLAVVSLASLAASGLLTWLAFAEGTSAYVGMASIWLLLSLGLAPVILAVRKRGRP